VNSAAPDNFQRWLASKALYHLAEFFKEVFDKMGSAIGSYTLINAPDHNGTARGR
jgi:hypothetical protein